MNLRELFSDKLARKIWGQYFRRVRWHSRSLNPRIQEELHLEIQDHLYESFKLEKGDSEAERLLNAIDKIGNPEEFIKPMIAEKLLTEASRTLNPKTIISGLYYNVRTGTKKLFFSLLFGLGYFISFVCGLMVILKILFPETSGLLIHRNGGWALGIIDEVKDIKEDILGFWIIPIGIILAVFIYWGLSRLLKRLSKY